MKCCVTVWICSYLVKSKILSAGGSQRYSRRSVFYAIRYPSDFRCIRFLTSALVGCARCTLGFRFPKKYAHQNDPLNQGNLHELKLRLKIVRYPGIEVDNTRERTITVGQSFLTNKYTSRQSSAFNGQGDPLPNNWSHRKTETISNENRFFLPSAVLTV